jgi:hypothetical protein
LSRLKALSSEPDRNAAAELHEKPIDLLYQSILCRDRGSGKTIEWTVVDCGTSILNGEYLVLEDKQGARTQVTAEELDEMRVK